MSTTVWPWTGSIHTWMSILVMNTICRNWFLSLKSVSYCKHDRNMIYPCLYHLFPGTLRSSMPGIHRPMVPLGVIPPPGTPLGPYPHPLRCSMDNDDPAVLARLVNIACHNPCAFCLESHHPEDCKLFDTPTIRLARIQSINWTLYNKNLYQICIGCLRRYYFYTSSHLLNLSKFHFQRTQARRLWALSHQDQLCNLFTPRPSQGVMSQHCACYRFGLS